MDFSAWVRQAETDDFWLLAALALAACGFGLFRGFVALLRKRMVEDVPTSRIRSAAQGYVELEGRCELMDGPAIIAPLSGLHCAWYQYAIQERRGSGKNRRWVTLESGTSDDLFLLIDDTGECVIDPDGARVTPRHRQKWYGPNRDSRPRTTGSRWFLLGGRFRFTESLLKPGEPLYALGLFETTGGAGGSDPQTLLKSLLREWKADTQMLVERFDRNNDGEIGLAEWEAVRAAAWAEVVDQHTGLQNATPVHTLTDTHDARRPYLLSALPQSDLVRRLQRRLLGYFVLALAGGALASFLVTTRLAG